MSKEEIKNIAVAGVRLVKKLLAELPDTEVQLEYSPESFSDTEVDYSLEVCEAVMNEWEPTEENPIILNLPATVELFHSECACRSDRMVLYKYAGTKEGSD